jgi:hypothetical protein
MSQGASPNSKIPTTPPQPPSGKAARRAGRLTGRSRRQRTGATAWAVRSSAAEPGQGRLLTAS